MWKRNNEWNPWDKTTLMFTEKYLTAGRNLDASVLTLKFQEALFEKQR